jgi:hypothetical protein
MVVRKWWARELGHEQEIRSRHVLQEFKLENLTVREREVGCSPVKREFEFVFLTVGNRYRNGRRERILSSEAMIYQWTSLGISLMIKKDNVPRPYTTSAPIRFQIRTPDDVVFNQELLLDLVFLDQRDPASLAVDAGSTYQAAIFLEGEGFVPVWNAFAKCWIRAYVGDPESITVDSASVFSSAAFAQTWCAHEITMKTTGVEFHSSLGVRESYHAPLRRIYRKLREKNPGVEREVLLHRAVFAMNSTLGTDGLVPILLVYG